MQSLVGGGRDGRRSAGAGLRTGPRPERIGKFRGWAAESGHRQEPSADERTGPDHAIDRRNHHEEHPFDVEHLGRFSGDKGGDRGVDDRRDARQPVGEAGNRRDEATDTVRQHLAHHWPFIGRPRPPTSVQTTAAQPLALNNGLPTAACAKSAAAAVQQSATAVKDVDPRVAVGIVVISRDAPMCTAAANGEETFPTASVVKLLIAIDVLRATNSDPKMVDRVETMLEVSDDAIASDLWSRYGANSIILRMKGLIGLPSLAPPADRQSWGSTRIDALDVARIWRYLLDVAPTAIRTPILEGTGSAKRTAADGFDQYFGIPDGLPEATWWIKQGWGTSDGRRVVNTTGLVGKNKDSIVVMLTSHPTVVGYAEATESVTRGIAALAAAVGEAAS